MRSYIRTVKTRNMFGSTWKTFRRPALMYLQLCAYMLAGAVFFSRCGTSNKVYEAPRLGAEYRFDEEYKKKKNKHPSNLFDKKTRQEMEKMGMLPAGSSGASGAKAKTTAPASGLSKTPPVSGLPADSAIAQPRKDSAIFKVRPQ